MGILNEFFNQTRNPEGFLGKVMLKTMNPGHSELANWGMSRLIGRDPAEIADLGCGGGRNAGHLLKLFPNAIVTAVDHSELAVANTRQYNKKAVAEGRMTVMQADVSRLPLRDAQSDLVTAFETIYFWPGLETCFAEVARILKPGGIFLIVNESDGTDREGLKFEKMIDGMKCYTSQEITKTLMTAGFSTIGTDHHKEKPWLAVVARK